MHAISCHPHYVVNDIPTGEMITAHHNCSDESKFSLETEQIHKCLECLKYPKWTLNKGNTATQKDYNRMIT